MLTQRALEKLLSPLKRRIQLMVGRAVLTAVSDSTKAQTVQASLLADEVRDDVERFGEFGFASVPPTGSEAIVVFVGGNRAHGVVIATEDRRYRPTGLSAGESCLYTQQNGKRVYCKTDGQVHLGTSPTEFVALATRTESRLAALESFAASHTHTGVTAGIAVTGTAPGAPTSPGTVAATEVKAK